MGSSSLLGNLLSLTVSVILQNAFAHRFQSLHPLSVRIRHLVVKYPFTPHKQMPRVCCFSSFNTCPELCDGTPQVSTIASGDKLDLAFVAKVSYRHTDCATQR